MSRRGFTLMEVLVVLMITGLLAGLLFTSLQTLAIADRRIAERAQREGASALAVAWWRDSAATVMADREVVFSGQSDAFEALATDTPQQTARQRRVRWSIAGASGDTLALDGEGLPRLTLSPGVQDLRFAYLDDEGRQHPRWPPAQGEHPMLPEAIVLLARGSPDRVVAMAGISGPRSPRPVAFGRDVE
jgi:prepilin-type N-terminal cleavage/methylation domain-containing protein